MTNLKLKMRGIRSFSTMALCAMPLCSAMLFTSCSNHGEGLIIDDSNELTEINLTSHIIEGTVNNWATTRAATTRALAEGEQVHVTVLSSNKMLYHQLLTSDNNGKLSGATTMYYPTNGGDVDVYAYFGGNYTITNANSNDTHVKEGSVLNISVEADQSSTTNYTKSDFIYGHALNQSRKNSDITLSLSHMLSRIQTTVTPLDSIKVTKIELKSLKAKATYTVGSTVGTVATTTDDAITITLYDNTTGSNAVVNSKAIVIPQSIANQSLVITTSDNQKFTHTFSNSTAALTNGKSYNYNVTLKATGLTIAATITEWDEQDTVDINADMDVKN